MKEAIGNAGVFNLVIIFVIILLSFFIGSLGYSKAFKVKNAIVNEIEKEGEYNNIAHNNIENLLSSIGYRMNTSFNTNNCPKEEYKNKEVRALNTDGDYQYCVYKFEDKTGSKESYHYLVVAYMYFDVPIINNLIRVPVRGETITFTTINS